MASLENIGLLQLYKPLSNGDTAILYTNNDRTAHDVTISWSSVPGLTPGGAYAVRDIWAHASMGRFPVQYTVSNVASHDSVFIRVTAT
jgi:hypothetical protein